jgi:hypothetical protein
MSAEGQQNLMQESQEYMVSEDKRPAAGFGVDHLDFTQMNQQEILMQFELQQ